MSDKLLLAFVSTVVSGSRWSQDHVELLLNDGAENLWSPFPWADIEYNYYDDYEECRPLRCDAV
jgi:hypothetical protein